MNNIYDEVRKKLNGSGMQTSDGSVYLTHEEKQFIIKFTERAKNVEELLVLYKNGWKSAYISDEEMERINKLEVELK